jgi:hypothetical protein
VQPSGDRLDLGDLISLQRFANAAEILFGKSVELLFLGRFSLRRLYRRMVGHDSSPDSRFG